MNCDDREQVVKEDLKKLKEEQYITQEIYFQVVEAHNQYYTDRNKEDTEPLEKSEAVHKQEERQQTTSVLGEKGASTKGPGLTAQKKSKQTPTTDDPNLSTEQSSSDLTAPKKKLSPQEVRERNITWLLNLGVMMLLIGGLILATSNWETLDNWMKSGLIVLVSILFFGLASLTMHGLKIRKTAFAFYVLGGLFLPISILSIGFLELLGPYFSVHGGGHYWFGASGSLVILPIYVLLADRLTSRLFVWFSYISLSLVGGFILAAIELPVDGFYLGMMVFNALLIVLYRLFRQRLQLFMKEFLLYLQGNLVLSTLLMIMFYQQEVAYSFNLILTAIIYFSMIYVTNHKEYHFVFSALDRKSVV